MAGVLVSPSFVPSSGVVNTRKNWGIIMTERCCVRTNLGQSFRSYLPVRCTGVAQPSGKVLTKFPAVEKQTPDVQAWKTFVERSSGEWDGHGADFNSQGEPSELPSQVVPDAFREWGVEIHDWQTMCPTLGREDPKTFGYRVIRMLPTVGCEADAATPYCTEENDTSTAVTCAFHPNGSYTAVWPGKGVVRENPIVGGTSKIVVRNVDVKSEWEVEHCLVNERGSTRDRARILQQFRVDDTTGSPELMKITVYIEQWDGPFRNGESLGGCSVSGSGFATTTYLQCINIAGTWNVDSFVAKASDSSPKPLRFTGSSVVERSELGGLISLPSNLWCSVKASQLSPSYTIEAGWLVRPEQSIVSSLEFLPSGEFQDLSIRFEQKV